MPIALVVGGYDAGDLIVATFQEKARNLGYDLASEPEYGTARAHLPDMKDDAVHHLVLFCAPRALRQVSYWLGALKPCARRTIVYAHTSRASADEAIRYCHEGTADAYLVMGDGSSERSIAELAVKLHRGEPPYPPFHLGPTLQTPNPVAFISTPFDRDNRSIMESAVDLALKKVGFTVEWGDRDYRQTLHDHIKEKIQGSSLLIANISLDRRNVFHNPNVYFEAGIATAFDLPIIFVRHAGEANVLLPADLHGRRWLSYDNEIDLALKLYHGLKA